MLLRHRDRAGPPEPERLTFDDGSDERQPFFSPDGTLLAFARYVWFRGQPFYESSEIRVFRVPPDQ